MAILVDIIVVAVIALFVLIGVKRGFIKEIVSLVGFVLAFLIAFFVSGVGSTFVYDTFVDGTVRDSVSEAVVSVADNQAGEIVSAIPDSFADAAESFGIDIDREVRDSMGGTIEETAASVAETVSEKIARPMITSIIRVTLFLIILIVVKLIIDWIGRALNIIAKLPLISGANALLGGVVGALRGVVIALILCYSVILIVDVRQSGILGITAETVEESYIFGFLAGLLK